MQQWILKYLTIYIWKFIQRHSIAYNSHPYVDVLIISKLLDIYLIFACFDLVESKQCKQNKKIWKQTNWGSKIINYYSLNRLIICSNTVPLLSVRLDLAQINAKHWKIWKYNKVWKIFILLGYPNKLRQYCQWNPKHWTIFQI